MWSRLVCWLRGHRWRTIAINYRKHVNLFHLSEMAGFHSVCDRCGHEWNDLGSPFFGDDMIQLLPAPLPEARLLP